jgi:hypothetical protein
VKKFVLAALATFGLTLPAYAQTVEERLQKARTEVNTTQNAASRAEYAVKTGNYPKALTEITATKNAANRALYAIDQAIAAVKPPPPPPPVQCLDGTSVPAGQTCPTPPPPPPPPPPSYAYTAAPVTVVEGGIAAVRACRSGSSGTSVLTYITANGTAVAPGDFVPRTDSTRDFTDTTLCQNLNIQTNDDTLVEGTETFTLNLNGQPVVITITDNDVAPPPPPAGGLSGETFIPSNFDITRTYSTSGTIPGSGAPDVVGAFRFICGAGQLKYDDPILFPGQPGKSHLHQFYGNVTADAHSTYSSLRLKGGSTCNYVGNPNVNWLNANPDVFAPDAVAANRSAYWMPAMLDGKGNVVRPDVVSIYYKARPANDPLVSDPTNPKYQGKGVKLPNGIKFIFGWDPTGINKELTGSRYFNCTGPTAKPGSYATLTLALANCPAGQGNQVGAVISAPSCWDGKNLDSADHRSHVSYISYGNWGYPKCPPTHPYVIPTFTMGAWYTVGAGDDGTLWHLASDHMAPGQPAGYTFHADFFMAWDDTVHDMWFQGCVNKLLNCSGGQLGNGSELRGALQPYYWDQAQGINRPMWKHPQRLVPVP